MSSSPWLTGGRFIGGNPTQPAPTAPDPVPPPAPNGVDTLGFGEGVGSRYYDDNPSQGFQVYTNMLGGQNTALGRYAAKHFNEVYAGYLKQSTANPNLTWTNYLNQYAGSGQGDQSYALASPFARDPYNTPQWAGTRYLG